ncbi:hypothetical protein BHE74_00055695 [Ensete ventricosum]|nr:hypothetical protein BHE74_00055695 [Ensete ventricosum]
MSTLLICFFGDSEDLPTRFSLPSGKPRTAWYILVRQLTGTWTGHYRVVPLKSIVGGRLKEKSTIGGRLRKKREEEEERRGEEERRRGKVPRPRALVTYRRLFSPCALVARGPLFSQHGERLRRRRRGRPRLPGDFSPRARRDRGDVAEGARGSRATFLPARGKIEATTAGINVAGCAFFFLDHL